MNNKIWLSLLGLGLIIGIASYFLLPWGNAPAKDYFAPIGERTLQEDEIGQFNYVLSHYEHLSFTGDEFKGWDTENQLYWRYGIAFGSYGMPSIAMISPEHADRATLCMRHMIDKMKSKKVWGDWTEFGLSDDPISEGNIMYKGHLNLMYALYQLMSGDERYADEFTWLTEKIVVEMREHHAEGKHEGADCEPGRYFAQCNSISLLSLKVYDMLYGTQYAEVEGIWTVDFIKAQMTDAHTGFYQKMYQSQMGFTNPDLSGYTNAWTISFLRQFDMVYNDQLYPQWKQKFVHTVGPYAYVNEDLEAGPSPLATNFGMVAAKEFGDVKLWNKFRNVIDRSIYPATENYHYLYEGINNPIYNACLLFAKVHVGWSEILNHDWKGTQRQYKKPEVADLAWTDILPQELMLMDDVLE